MCRLSSSQKSDEMIACVHSLPGYLAKWIPKSDMWTIAMSGSKIFDKWKDKRENFVRLQYIQKSSGINDIRTGQWRRWGHRYVRSISYFPSSYIILLPNFTKILQQKQKWATVLLASKRIRESSMSFCCSSLHYFELDSNQIHEARLRIMPERKMLAAYWKLMLCCPSHTKNMAAVS